MMPLPIPFSLLNLPPPFLLPHLHSILHNAVFKFTLQSNSKTLQQTRSIRSLPHRKSRSNTLKPRNRFINHPSSHPLPTAHPAAALKRKAFTLLPRTGALGIKKGMSAIFDAKTGKRTPVTILQLDRNQVVAHKTVRKHGYYAVQVGHGVRNTKNVSRQMQGHYAASGVSPKADLVEFRVKDNEALARSPVGSLLPASWFRVGQFVDARANCRGMGFEGPMKRHGMHGQPASHGQSLMHRGLGSAGQSQGGGSRVYPGKRMAGNMGGQRVTMQNLRVVRVDGVAGLVVVRGCVAGPKGCLVQLSDAIKKPWPKTALLPPLTEALEVKGISA